MLIKTVWSQGSKRFEQRYAHNPARSGIEYYTMPLKAKKVKDKIPAVTNAIEVS